MLYSLAAVSLFYFSFAEFCFIIQDTAAEQIKK